MSSFPQVLKLWTDYSDLSNLGLPTTFNKFLCKSFPAPEPVADVAFSVCRTPTELSLVPSNCGVRSKQNSPWPKRRLTHWSTSLKQWSRRRVWWLYTDRRAKYIVVWGSLPMVLNGDQIISSSSRTYPGQRYSRSPYWMAQLWPTVLHWP